ncbi:hypothetical protein F5I97DRAFT_52360 [Phlebopus sp. FC_14]|nr:hypothetical protein F5I97DRAFT_52360 [Phlebopus sp. FC_14]
MMVLCHTLLVRLDRHRGTHTLDFGLSRCAVSGVFIQKRNDCLHSLVSPYGKQRFRYDGPDFQHYDSFRALGLFPSPSQCAPPNVSLFHGHFFQCGTSCMLLVPNNNWFASSVLTPLPLPAGVVMVEGTRQRHLFRPPYRPHSRLIRSRFRQASFHLTHFKCLLDGRRPYKQLERHAPAKPNTRRYAGSLVVHAVQVSGLD